MTSIIRRIQVVGNRSFAISLPKKWVLENELDKKRNVNINIANNNLILSSNTNTTDYSKLDVFVEDTSLVTSILLLCYTKGISELILRFESSTKYLEAKEELNNILSVLDGFKITDEDNKKIILNSIYEKYDIKISKLAKRMTSILNQMIDCILNNKVKTKLILENELDSLYHLSKRILYICSVDSDVRIKNDILDIEEIFLWRLIFKKIENVGDIIETFKIEKNKREISKLNSLITPLNDLFILNKKITNNQINFLSKQKFIEVELEKIKNLVIDILNNYLLIKLNFKYFNK